MLTERLRWLDAAKGIGILLVVTGHVLDGGMGLQIIDSDITGLLYRSIYLFHMPLFFLLSGYAFAMSLSLNYRKTNDDEQVGRKFLWGGVLSKCLNLLILYVFWTSLMFIFKIIFSPVINHNVEGNLLRYLIIDSTQTPYWYLITLFYYYLLCWVIISFRKEKNFSKITYWTSFLVAAVIPFIFHQILDLNYNFSDYVYKILYHFFYFVFGYALFYYRGVKKSLPASAIIILGIVCLIAGTVFKQAVELPFVRVIVAVISSIGLLQFIVSHKSICESKILCYLGKNSIYIYLVHNYFTVLCRTVYLKLGIQLPEAGYILTVIGISVMGSVLVSWIVKKFWLLDIFFNPVKVFHRINSRNRERT